MWDVYLIVDDNKFDRLICNRIIAKIDEGASMVECESANDLDGFLRSGLEKDQRALIFLDINMPEVNGFEYIERMKEDPDLRSLSDRVTIVIMTSSTRQSDQEKAKDYELVRAFIQKPMKVAEVKEALESIS